MTRWPEAEQFFTRNTEAAAIIELKIKEILLSQASVWNRMSREQQNLVLKEIHPKPIGGAQLPPSKG